MKISCKARYAVVAMVDMASQNPSSPRECLPVSLREISQRQELPLPFLEQLFRKLKKSALVTSIRGNQGGYRLARQAHDISILDILLAVEGPFHATRCQPDSPRGCQEGGGRCATHTLWEGLGAMVRTYFKRISLADVRDQNAGRLNPHFAALETLPDTGGKILESATQEIWQCPVAMASARPQTL